MRITYPTGIRYSSDLFNAVNHMTYFLDPNWTFTQEGLPAVFFYLMSESITRRNEINTAAMIVVNGNTQDPLNSSRLANTQVVADNTVPQPEERTMEILVPNTIEQLNYFRRVSTVTDWVGGLVGNDLFKVFMNILGRSLFADPNASTVSLLTSLFANDNTEQPDSLRRMADTRLPIQMKLPTGWKFQNGIITSLEMARNAEETGFTTASITMMMSPPILQMMPRTIQPTALKQNPIKKAFGENILLGLKKIGGLP